MSCNLCQSSKYKIREGSVRGNKDLEIKECLNCGLVYLSSTEAIDSGFYENSSMNETFNFSQWNDEKQVDDKRRFDFMKNKISNKKILDFGSGYGGFLSYSKEVSSYACGVELEKAIKPFYKENHIDLFENLNEIDETFDVITAFHVIEHLKEPAMILKEFKNLLNKNGKIILEVPNASDALLTIYENKPFSHFTYWVCHLYLYTQHTLSLLAKKAGLKVDFVKHIQRYPLSNHLYWLSKGKPGGHMEWGNFIDSKELNAAYEKQLAKVGATDTIIVQLSKEES